MFLMLSKELKFESYRRTLHKVIRDQRISLDARVMWVLLETYTNQQSWKCFPGIDTLTEVTGRSKPWVLSKLKELQDHGFLIKSKRRCENGMANLYELKIPPAGEVGKKNVKVGKNPLPTCTDS